MNFFQRLKVSWAMSQKNMSLQLGKLVNNVTTFMGTSTDSLIENGFEANPNVYSAMKAIERPFTKGTWMLQDQDGQKQELPELTKLLNRPNPIQGRAEFMGMAITFKKITGEVFIHKIYPDDGPNAGKPVQMWVIPTQLLEKIATDMFGLPVEYHFRVGATLEKVPAEDIIHIREINLQAGSIRGMSPLKPANKVVKQSNDGYTALMKLLQNAGPAGILSYEHTGGGDAKEQAGMLKGQYDSKYTGPENLGGVVVTAAKLGWTQIGLSATDLELLEAQKMSLRDICNVFGFSSQVLNDPDNKAFNNVREAEKNLIQNVIIPEHEAFISAFEVSLLPHFEEAGRFSIVVDKSNWEQLKADFNEQVQALNTAWWLTPNRKLEMMNEDKSSDPNMDLIYIPSGFMPIAMDTPDEKALEIAYGKD